MFYTSLHVWPLIKKLTYLLTLCLCLLGSGAGLVIMVVDPPDVFSLFIVFILLCNELNTSIFGKLLWLCDCLLA